MNEPGAPPCFRGRSSFPPAPPGGHEPGAVNKMPLTRAGFKPGRATNYCAGFSLSRG